MGGIPYIGVNRWTVGYKAGARKADPAIAVKLGEANFQKFMEDMHKEWLKSGRIVELENVTQLPIPANAGLSALDNVLVGCLYGRRRSTASCSCCRASRSRDSQRRGGARPARSPRSVRATSSVRCRCSSAAPRPRT